jgi:glycosyltransferase involved in cell wall biosynthesis
MRAHLVLAALARRCDVSLLVAARYPSPLGGDAATAAVAAGAREGLAVADGDDQAAVAAYGGRHFDIVHAFRLAALPIADALAASLPAGATRRWLDLDEVESAAQRRIAALHRLRGEDAAAVAAEDEANRLAVIERGVAARCERIMVASEYEREHLGGADGRTVVLPNALPALPDMLPPSAPLEPGVFRFCFVGTLGYLPNADAVSWFARAVLPGLMSRTGRAVELLVAGTGESPEVSRLDGRPGIRLLGEVNDVADVYRAAHAVVVPLRAGGGTRIKVLEAFAFGRPVVTTALGVEGLAVLDRVHALVAPGDEPRAADDFAARCAELVAEPALGQRLAAAGRSLLLRRHGGDAAQRVVDALLADQLSGPASARPSY